MREFSKISPSVWRSKRFVALPNDDARYLYLYLLTNEHQTNAGAYHIKDGTAADDLHWEKQRITDALAALTNADLILHDAETAELAITRWFKHNPPMSESHLVGVEKTLERIESSAIADAVTKDLWEAWEAFQAKKAEAEAKAETRRLDAEARKQAAKQRAASSASAERIKGTSYYQNGGLKQ